MAMWPLYLLCTVIIVFSLYSFSPFFLAPHRSCPLCRRKRLSLRKDAVARLICIQKDSNSHEANRPPFVSKSTPFFLVSIYPFWWVEGGYICFTWLHMESQAPQNNNNKQTNKTHLDLKTKGLGNEQW